MTSHLMHDYTQAELDPQTRGMLDFADRLTREPASIREEDIAALRHLGLEDEQILSVVLITCLFNFMTRVADGLGVEVPPQTERAVRRWLGDAAGSQEWLITAKG